MEWSFIMVARHTYFLVYYQLAACKAHSQQTCFLLQDSMPESGYPGRFSKF